MDNNKSEEVKKDRKKSIKKVCWDEEKIAEQMEERLKHPKMKITEPKTPFNEIDDNETDEYLLKLKEVNQIVPDKESLEKALEALSKKNFNEEQEGFNEHEDEKKRERNKQMQKKAYANEFLFTKKLTKELENEDDEIVKETLENTVYNKYIGKLTKDSNE